jgi:hypothetical protein
MVAEKSEFGVAPSIGVLPLARGVTWTSYRRCGIGLHDLVDGKPIEQMANHFHVLPDAWGQQRLRL